MRNIWYIFGTIVIASFVLIIVSVILIIKKPKNYILSEVIIILLITICLISDIPYMKDIAKQETTEIVAVYVKYQKGNIHPGSRKLFFEDEKQSYELLTPIITKNHVKMEVGKVYKIEYFVNSRVIKKYVLIEH